MCGVLGLSWSPAYGQPTAPAQADSTKIYHELAAKLKGGDLSIDFRALRFACSAAPDCEVRANVTDLNAITEAQKRVDLEAAREVCERLLDRGYANMETHADLAAICENLGDWKRGAFHLAVVTGLLASIRGASGNSKETAMEVVSLREIYMVMVSLGLPYFGDGVSQKDFQEGSHQYQSREARDPKTGKMRRVYFNLDHVGPAKNMTNRP